MAKAGRKEILTEQIARQIAKMIEGMPDAAIPVTWEKVISHAKARFRHTFKRQQLSQKQWDGRKIIAEAFQRAKDVQRRLQRDSAPKYRTAARAVLQRRIAELEATNLSLQEELEEVRAQQIEKLDAFLTSGVDLRTLLEAVRLGSGRFPSTGTA